MNVQTDFIPVTPASIYANITLQLEAQGLPFQQIDGLDAATVNLRACTVAARRQACLEDVVSVEGLAERSALYQKTLPLAPGRYRLNIAAKDITGGNTGSYEVALDVPQFQDDKLSASSLILADLMERVPARSIGAGQFVIGDTKSPPAPSDRRLPQRREARNLHPALPSRARLRRRTNRTSQWNTKSHAMEPRTPSSTTQKTWKAAGSSQLTLKKWISLGESTGRFLHAVSTGKTESDRKPPGCRMTVHRHESLGV